VRRDFDNESAGRRELRLWGGDGASPVSGTNLNELLGSLSKFAALLPASILRMPLASPYQQDRLRPFFQGFCQDFV